MTAYTLEGSAVLCDGREWLSYDELHDFMRYAVPRKLRRRGHIDAFFAELRTNKESDYGWSYTRFGRYSDKQSAYVTVRHEEGGYRLRCSGAKRDYTLTRVCRTLARNEERKNVLRGAPPKRHRRDRKSKKKRERLIASQIARAEQPRTGKRRRKSPAPLSLKDKEKQTPQFRRQHFFWDEAIRAVVDIFEVKGTWKQSASQLVAKQLYASLEQNGERFAQFKRRGFALRFDLADGMWRGDLTRLLISATKDNSHPTYRRMRDYFRDLFLHPGGEAQAVRRYRDVMARSLPKGVVLWKGVRFAA